MAVRSTKPLSKWIKEYEADEYKLAAFPQQDGKKFALRIVNPDDETEGLAQVATFKDNVPEAIIPENRNDAILANRDLNDLIHDPKRAVKLLVCLCVVDDESIEMFPDKYTEDDKGTEFFRITAGGTAKSLAFEDLEDEKPKVSRKRR